MGKKFAVVLTDRAYGDRRFAHRHLDLARNVVVNNDARRAFCLCDVRLFFKGVRATSDERDLSRNVKTAVIGGTSCTWDRHVFKLHLRNARGEKFFNEVLFLGNAVGRLGKVNDTFVVKQVRRLHSVDRSNRESALVGRGRTDRRGIGVRGKTEVTVLIRAVVRTVCIRCSNDKADAERTDPVVNARLRFLIGLTAETATRTERHIDDVDFKKYAVFQSGNDPGSTRRIGNVGEGLHNGKLRVRRNTRDDVVVTRNNARHVRAVIVEKREDLGIAVGIVKAERHFFVDIEVGRRQTRLHSFRTEILARKESRQLLFRKPEVRRRKLFKRESGMGVVKSRIKNRNDHSLSVISKSLAVKNTRILHVDLVLYKF